MNFELLGKRLASRLTNVTSLVFALTRHWILIAVFIALGSVAVLAKVSTDTVVYEAKASLMLSSAESMVVEQDRVRERAPADAAPALLQRVELLTSDSVLRRIVEELRTDLILSQEENPDVQGYGAIRKAIVAAKEALSSVGSLLGPKEVRDVGPEKNVQRAMASFRLRSQVVPNFKTGLVQLRLYGHDRDLLLREMRSWIEAYQSRLVAMVEESREFYISQRVRQWQAKEQEAKEVLDAFRKQNGDLSRPAQDLLVQSILRLETRAEDLRKELQLGQAPVDPAAEQHARDPEVQALLAQKLELVRKINESLVTFGEQSDVVKQLREQLQIVTTKLQGVEPGTPMDPTDRRRQVGELLDRVTAAIVADRTRLSRNAELLDQLQALEEEHKRAQGTHQNYRLMLLEQADRIESLKQVQVYVADQPMVSWQPYNQKPERQVLLGTVAGLLTGILVALLFESLQGRVRFKDDVCAEFGVPVVGVIPRK
jgi:uncharacterized protein involved in exopolysaccharide biosynthesis